MTQRLLALAATFLAAGSGAAALAAESAGAWEIGPIIRGRNHSVGMPLHPDAAGRGWAFECPGPGGSVHYVSVDPGPLAGASHITVRYRVDAARGARFVPQERPAEPGTVSLYFQRAGDSWKGRTHEYFRWYAPPATVQDLSPGVHQMTVSLRDPAWVSVFGKAAATNPRGFAEAMAGASRVGLVFGSAGARGHGVYATAPARFTLIDFRIS
jgi:hypothetical protein